MKRLLIIILLVVMAFSMLDLVCMLQAWGVDFDPDNDGINNLPGCGDPLKHRPAYCYPDSCGYRR